MKFRHNYSLHTVPVGWAVYTFMMVVTCLVLTFPYDPLHAMFLLKLSEKAGLDIHTDGWSLRLPAGVVWSHPSIAVSGLERIDAEQMQVEVQLSSLLRGQPVLLWSGRLGRPDQPNGVFKGELSMASLSWSGPAQFLANVDHVDLSHLALPLVKKGFLRARFEHRWTNLWEGGRFSLQEGTWNLELNDLVLEQLSIGSQSSSPLTIASLSGRLECQSGTCRIESLRGETQDGMLSGEGHLVFQDPLSTSHLSVTLSVIMTEALKERLHLTSLGPGTPGLPQKMTVSGPLSSLHVSL